MSAAAPNIEADGQFLQWLKQLDLEQVWLKATELEPRRCDHYRGLLLKIYTTERRKAERSQRFQLSRGVL